MDLDRSPVYVEGGVVWYRASGLGGCVRGLALARQGYDPLPPPPDMLKVFEAGNRAEQEVWSKGIVTGRAQEYVELPISDTIRVAGHLDSWTKEGVYEIKSQSEGEWRPIRESPLWERYRFQCGVYMLATGLPLTVVRVKRGAGGEVKEVAQEQFSQAPVTIREVRERVFQVEMLARKDLGDVVCEKVEYPCPFYYTHVDKVRGGDGGDGVEVVDDPAAVVLARQYLDARTVAMVADSRVKASRGALLEYMGDRKRLELSDKTLLTRYKVGAKHVEYDRGEYWALKITPRKVGEGEAGADRL